MRRRASPAFPQPPRRRLRDHQFSLWTFVAPAALLVCVVIVVSVVRDGLRHDPKPAATAASAGTTSTAAAAKPTVVPKTYLVRKGDSLSQIASRFGISLAALRRLNPRIDPQAIKPGQHLRLR